MGDGGVILGLVVKCLAARSFGADLPETLEMTGLDLAQALGTGLGTRLDAKLRSKPHRKELEKLARLVINDTVVAQAAEAQVEGVISNAAAAQRAVRRLLLEQVTGQILAAEKLDPDLITDRLMRDGEISDGTGPLNKLGATDRDHVRQALLTIFIRLDRIGPLIPNLDHAVQRELLLGADRIERRLQEQAEILARWQRDMALQDEKQAKHLKAYLAAVQCRYDMLDMYLEGATGGPVPELKLRTAYVTLSARMADGDQDRRVTAETLLDSLPVRAPRILIRGEAGSGKTTLMQWIAIQTACGEACATWEPPGTERRRGLLAPKVEPDDIKDNAVPAWRQAIPILVKLRHLPDFGASLLEPSRLPGLSAPELALSHARAGWVEPRLKAGRIILLVDGLDEMPRAATRELKRALATFLDIYPHTPIIVTTRPRGVPADWLSELDFREATVTGLDEHVRGELIRKWYDALSHVPGLSAEERAKTVETARRLVEQVQTTPALRILATTPLLCAMLCALNRMRRGTLPRRLPEICEAMAKSLAERQSVRYAGPPGEEKISLDQKTAHPAYAMLSVGLRLELAGRLALAMQNSELGEEEGEVTEDAASLRSTLLFDDAVKLVAATVPSIRELQDLQRGNEQKYARQIVEDLRDRAALLREPIEGRLEFSHNILKEYLAAKCLIKDRITPTGLVQLVSAESWGATLVFAASSFDKENIDLLIKELLSKAQDETTPDRAAGYFAIRCHDVVDLVDPDLSLAVNDTLPSFFPPRTESEARAAAELGRMAVPYLHHRPKLSEDEEAACVTALDLIGGTQPPSDVREALLTFQETRSHAAAVILARHVENPLHLPYWLEVCMGNDPDLLEPVARLIKSLQGIPFPRDVEAIRLMGAQINDLSPLSKLTELRTLDLDDTNVSDLSPLSELHALAVLFLNNTSVTDLSPLSKLHDLEMLNLNNTGVTDLFPLRSLSNLQYIYLRGTQVSDLSPLDEIPELKVDGP